MSDRQPPRQPEGQPAPPPWGPSPWQRPAEAPTPQPGAGARAPAPPGPGPWNTPQPQSGTVPWNDNTGSPGDGNWPAGPTPAPAAPPSPWQLTPGYQPGWPPGASPQGAGRQGAGRRRVLPILIVAPLAAVAAVAIGVAIAFAIGGGNEGDDTTFEPVAQRPATTAVPAPLSASADPSSPAQPPAAGTAGAPPGAPGCIPVPPVTGPAPAGGETVLDIGQTAVVTGEEYFDFEVRVTLNSACTQAAAFTSWSDPSVQGTFVLANVTVEVVRGTVSASYFDFAVQTADGSRYEGDYPPIEPRLASFDLRAGQTARGYVLVDAPVGHNLLRWEPIFAANSAVWRY